MSNADQKLRSIKKRADKNLWITAILTLFIPFGGYIYTLRYTVAVIAFFVMMLLLSAEEVVDEETADTLYGFFIIGVAVENSIAVYRAREVAREKGLKPGTNSPTPLMDTKVQILKVGQQRGEMTLSDFVVATEIPPEQLQETLMELERSDLIRSYNRESDGAIVYRVI